MMLELNKIYCADCLELMKQIDDNSVDAIVTDPPYGLSFMGKKRDYDVPSKEIREECLRVLKPWGYLLAFAWTRTQHRMAVRIEDAWFEIRDMIAWIYGSGFPKSLSVWKAINKMETEEWLKIWKALDIVSEKDIIQIWKNKSNNVSIVETQSLRNQTTAGQDMLRGISVQANVVEKNNQENWNLLVNFVVKNLQEVQALWNVGINTVLQNVEAEIRQKQDLAKYVEQSLQNQNLKYLTTSTAEWGVNELQREKTSQIIKVEEVLMILRGNKKYWNNEVINALCVVLTEDLKLTILNQSKTFQSLDMKSQMECVSAINVTITESTAECLISNTVDIAKKIVVDKLQGNEREITGSYKVPDIKGDAYGTMNDKQGGSYKNIEVNLTKGTSEWEGWGTALKPSLESITLAQKTIDFSSLLDIMIKKNLYILKKELCQFPLCVWIAEKHLQLNQQEQGENVSQSIAEWIAEENINIQVDLSVVIDMLQSELTENMNLNIVLLWLSILVDLYNQTNTYTTETKTSLTIDLITLSYLEFENIYQSIIQAKDSQTNELNVNVYNAESLFKGLQLKLKTIQEHFAQECVISKAAINSPEGTGITPNLSPIIMSRKPLSEKNVAENCLKWWVGGINIDWCRVEIQEYDKWWRRPNCYEKEYEYDDTWQFLAKIANWNIAKQHNQWRFPANLIHDWSEEVVELFPDSKSTQIKWVTRQPRTSWVWDWENNWLQNGSTDIEWYNDSGSSARFFYCAKTSKSERNMGCEELEEKLMPWTEFRPSYLERFEETWDKWSPRARFGKMLNNHPTVKPLALMEYLVKLVSKEWHIVLDPFLWSWTTAMACKKLGRNRIGCEMSPEYVEIAEKRINAVEIDKPEINNQPSLF